MNRRDLKRFRRLVEREARELRAVWDAVPASVVSLPAVWRTKIQKASK